MAHVFPVGNRLDGGADHHRTHRPRPERRWTPSIQATSLAVFGPRTKRTVMNSANAWGCAGARPDAHQPAEQPQIQHQNAGRIGRSQGGHQHLAGQIVLTQHQRTGHNPAQQRRHRFAGDPAQEYGDNRR